MSNKIVLIILLLNSLGLFSQPIEEIAPLQQQNIDTEEKLKTKLGIKFALGTHTFYGTELKNTKLLYGFGAGIYNIIPISKSKKVQLHWEFDITFKGSKFGHPNDTSYSRISLSYAEIPLYLSIQIANTPKKQPLHLLIGAQGGILYKSSISQGYGKWGEVKYNSLPFYKLDFMPAIGLRKEIGSGMSLQTTTKIGLVNINTSKLTSGSVGTRYPDIVPPMTGKGTIKNFSFELALLF